jgi:small-conductance mechanosensitive channel
MEGLALPFATGYLYALITLLMGTAAAFIAHLIIRWLHKKAGTTETMLDDIVLTALGKPIVVSIFAISVYIALKAYNIIPLSMSWILTDQVIDAFYILVGAWVLSVFCHNFISTYGKMIAERTKGDFDDRLIRFLEVITKYVIWFAAILLLLHNFHIDITPFLAGAGIAGLALALAAQDILSNFFGGAMITLDKPFKIGDRIQIDTYVGDVVSVGPRSTRIRTLDNQLVTVPNSKITGSIVVNYAMPDPKLKVRIPVSVAYGTDVAKVREILLGLAREAAQETSWILKDPEPGVYFLEFGESSLNFQLIVWASSFDVTWEVKDWLNTRIGERFAQEGIEIPFRQIDVRMREQGKT